MNLLSHKQIGIIFLMFLLVVPLASAFEFDNVKQYDERTRTATIRNSIIGLPTDTVATIKLETPQHVTVQPGRNRLVAVMKVTNIDGEYNNFLSDMTFYNLNILNRDDLIFRTPPANVKYRQYVVVDTKLVEDWEWECAREDMNKPNKAQLRSCSYVQVGTHREAISEWRDFNINDPLPTGEVTIGMFVDVRPDDQMVEWIPRLFGEEIEEWASFGVAHVNAHGLAVASDGTRTKGEGERLIANGNITITEVARMTGVTAETIAILDSSRNTIAVRNISEGDSAIWEDGEVNITDGTIFYVTPVFRQDHVTYGGTYTIYRNNAASYPYQNVSFNWTGIVYDWTGNGTGAELIGGSQVLGISNITAKRANGTASLPVPSIAITLTFPSNNTEVTNTSYHFNATLLPSNINLTNATLYFSNTNGTVFAKKTSTLDNTKNFTNESVQGITTQSYYWTFRGCGLNNTGGHQCFYPTAKNFTFTKSDVIPEITVASLTYETSRDTFQANVTTVSNITAVAASLTYNGTAYPATISNTSGTLFTIERDLDIPLITSNTQSQNISYSFNLSYLLGGVLTTLNTTTSTQRVDAINVSLLAQPYTVPYINFTVYDQETLALLQASIGATFDFGLNNTDKTQSYQYTGENYYNHTFAFSPVNLSYVLKGTFEFGKAGYDTQTYTLAERNITNITNGMTEIYIYLVNASDSTTFTINVKDSSFLDVVGAVVEVQRFYPGTAEYKTVQSVTTNSVGKALVDLVTSSVTYRFRVFVDGKLSLTSTPTQVLCEVVPCTITLTIPSVTDDPFDNIGETENFTATLVYDETTQVFTYTYVDLAADAQGGRLHVRRLASSGDVVVCSNNNTDPSAAITCDVSATTNGTYVATSYLERTTQGGRVVGLLLINKVKSIVNTLGIDGILIAVFIYMGIVMLGLFKPQIAIGFAVLGVFGLRFLGLLDLPWLSFLALICIAVILAWEMRK